MENKSWIFRGIIFGIMLWVLVYIVFPQFNDEQALEPEKHYLELIFAIPAGILWGYYRFVILPKKMEERDKRMGEKD